MLSDHPQTDGIYAEARALIDEVTSFTIERDLIGDPGGECLVGPAPPSMSWAMAMMAWAAPFEADAPSWYWVTPPDPTWPAEEQEEWLTAFSRTTLPAITVHEVTPGHYAHGRSLRRLTSDVRKALLSFAFCEGWAHYAEELFLEEGFRADDPRFAIGRVHRGACPRHAARRGDRRAHRLVVIERCDSALRGRRVPCARDRQERGHALHLQSDVRLLHVGQARGASVANAGQQSWGAGYTHRRFHDALFALGAPPLGLLDHALSTP